MTSPADLLTGGTRPRPPLRFRSTCTAWSGSHTGLTAFSSHKTLTSVHWSPRSQVIFFTVEFLSFHIPTSSICSRLKHCFLSHINSCLGFQPVCMLSSHKSVYTASLQLVGAFLSQPTTCTLLPQISPQCQPAVSADIFWPLTNHCAKPDWFPTPPGINTFRANTIRAKPTWRRPAPEPPPVGVVHWKPTRCPRLTGSLLSRPESLQMPSVREPAADPAARAL